MKIKCDFCKTEYSLDKVPSSPLKCALCGHVWSASRPSRRGAWMTFIAASCALLSAIVFTVAVIVRSHIDGASHKPLLAEISEIKTVTDKDGVAHFVVHGAIVNQTTQIYGVPDLIIVSRDASGNPIARQKFMPSVPLLDAGASIEFNYTLSSGINGVKKITVELQTGDK